MFRDFLVVFGFTCFVTMFGFMFVFIINRYNTSSAKDIYDITYLSAKQHIRNEEDKEHKLNKHYYKWYDKTIKKINKEILKSAREHYGFVRLTVTYKDEYKNKFTIEKFMESEESFKKHYKKYGYATESVERESADSYTITIEWYSKKKDVDNG